MIKSLALAAALAVAYCSQAQTLKDGLRQLEVERYGDATRTLKALAASAPTAENLFYAGYAYAQQNAPDSARYYFGLATQKDAKNPLALIGSGTADILAGNKAAAAPKFAEATKNFKSKSAEVYYRIGEAYTAYATNDAPEAIKHLTKAAELDKGRPDILVMLGDAYVIPNDGSAAATAYDKAISIAPNYTKAHIRLGQIYERAKSYKPAYDKYREGLNKDSTYTPGFRQLAELQRKARQREPAIVNYRKYIQRSDQNPEAMLRFAGFLIEAGQYQEAAQYLAQLQGKTKKPIYQRLLAYTQYETGNAAQAEQTLNTFLQTMDTTQIKVAAMDYEYLGKINLATSKDTAKALSYLYQAVAKDSSRREVFKSLGDSAFAKKQYRPAAMFYKGYVRVSPSATSTDYFRLGQAQYFAKEYRPADSSFAQVVEVSKGKQPTGILYRAYALATLEPVKSNQFFEEFLKVTSDTSLVPLDQQPKFKRPRADALSRLSAHAANNNQRTKAEKLAQEALVEDPANKQAAQILAQLKAAPPAPPAASGAPKKGK